MKCGYIEGADFRLEWNTMNGSSRLNSITLKRWSSSKSCGICVMLPRVNDALPMRSIPVSELSFVDFVLYAICGASHFERGLGEGVGGEELFRHKS